MAFVQSYFSEAFSLAFLSQLADLTLPYPNVAGRSVNYKVQI